MTAYIVFSSLVLFALFTYLFFKSIQNQTERKKPEQKRDIKSKDLSYGKTLTGGSKTNVADKEEKVLSQTVTDKKSMPEIENETFHSPIINYSSKSILAQYGDDILLSRDFESAAKGKIEGKPTKTTENQINSDKLSEFENLERLVHFSQMAHVGYNFSNDKGAINIRINSSSIDVFSTRAVRSESYLSYQDSNGLIFIPKSVISLLEKSESIEAKVIPYDSSFFDRYRIHLGSKIRKGFSRDWKKYVYNDRHGNSEHIGVCVEINGSNNHTWDWCREESFFGSDLDEKPDPWSKTPSIQKYEELWEELLEIRKTSINSWGENGPKRQVAGVYAFLSMLSHECYIGSSTNMKQRRTSHLAKLQKGNHHSHNFQAAYKDCKGKEFEFIVLKEITDAEWDDERDVTFGRAETDAEDKRRYKIFLKNTEQDFVNHFYPSLNVLTDTRGRKHWGY